MTFSSLSFIFMFLPLTILLYIVTPKKWRNITLLIVSLVFYAWGNVYHVFLLTFLIIVNYGLGHYIDAKQATKRKRRLIEAIIINVVVLFYFKYYGFVLESVFSFIPHPPTYTLFTIPLGISFFTFSVIAYLIDIYRCNMKAEKNLMLFALFVSFFPKLIMGPIERYDMMKKQFLSHPMRPILIEQGCTKFMVGLAQKLIIANTLGSVWMNIPSNASMATAWLGIFAYTLQIYFDFQGYTQMAIGLGNIFGFQLSENFHYPYIATSVSDFWRRWHITLSMWFKDYVYIPLGGNRVALQKVLRNLLIVWGLTGFWHGASWNFIVWGLYYGLILIGEKYVWNKALKKCPMMLRWLLTLLVVMIGWVFFASDQIGSAFAYLGNMFMLRNNGLVDLQTTQIIGDYGLYFVIAIIGCTPLIKNSSLRLQNRLKAQMWYLKPIVTTCFFLIIVSFLVSNTYQAFLYFKF